MYVIAKLARRNLNSPGRTQPRGHSQHRSDAHSPPWLIFGLALLFGLLLIPAANPRVRNAGSVIPISQSLCDEMKVHQVLNARAPVGCERLKLIKFSYVDFDGRLVDDGEIVVMDAAAAHVLDIFAALRKIRFPIAKARLMNHYDGNDDASMADNNTSAFNVRAITGGDTLSLHAYGLAIDINPVQNPFAKRSGATLTFSPPVGVENANRLNDRPEKPKRLGMAEAVIDIFADHGFLIWGGYWDDPIDYQHFQVSRKLAERLAKLPPDQARAVYDRQVQRYRTCRRTLPQGPESRAKCIMAVDAEGLTSD